ncbi:MAG TPA: hypothetical protein VNL73_06130 [Verrucomicrobiae bacterium]|nr:hypothetical protein [Verrucomicrobiae bacterium]
MPTNSCCLTPGGIATKAASTIPPDSKTGYSREGCYATLLNDCGGKLSNEHYLSENILNILNQKERGGLRVGGLRWQKNEDLQSLPPTALTARILCERHNASLSILDSKAGKFFRAFDNLAGNTQDTICLFNGHDIERWSLKFLCGLIASNSLKLDPSVKLEIPNKWVEVLFGLRGFELGQGLYVCCSKGTEFSGRMGVTLRPFGQGDQITGIIFWICGFELIFSMRPLGSQDLFGRQVSYRPGELHIVGPKYEKSVVLSWDEPAGRATIHLKLKETW